MRKLVSTTALLCFICVSPSAYAWSEQDTLWEAAYLATSLAQNSEHLKEQCGAGKAGKSSAIPSAGCMGNNVIKNFLLHVGIASLLPRKHRRAFQQNSFSFDFQSQTKVAQIGVSFTY